MYRRRKKIDTMWLKRNDAKRFICMIITIVLSVYPMSLSPVWNGKIPGHRDQYERMAQSILHGHLYLEYEDVEEDKKKQNYNPLAIYSKKADFEEFAGHLLTMMIAEASRAFEQLPILKNAEILRNILYSGVWCRYEMIKEKRRQKAEAPDE